MDRTVKDYSMSKYQDELTERAYALTLDGFHEDSSGDLACGVDWSALVVVDGRHVIIRQDEQGFVWRDYDEDIHNPLGTSGRCAVMRAWRDYEWMSIVAENERLLAGSDY